MKYLNTLEIESLLNQEDLTQKQDHAVSLIVEIIKKPSGRILQDASGNRKRK